MLGARLAFNYGVDVVTAVYFGHRPEPRVLRAMPVMPLGLALALDVLGAASGLGAAGQWARPSRRCSWLAACGWWPR